MVDAREHLRLLLLGGNDEDALLVRTLLSRVAGMRFDLRIVADARKDPGGQQDLILLDHSGDRSFARLRALRQAGCATPIIVLTDRPGAEIEERALSAGAIDCLPKHQLEPRLFAVAIKRAVEEARSVEALRRSEERYRALVEHSSDAILLTDRSGSITWASPSITRLLGHQPADLVGRPASWVVHEADRADTQSKLLECLGAPGRNVTCVFRACHKDGRVRWFEGLATNRTEDAAVDAIVLTCRDVTERTRAEEALARSEWRFRSLVKNAVFGIYRSAPDGRFIEVNPALVAMLGYGSEEELLGIPVANLFRNPAQRLDLANRVKDSTEIQGLEVEWQHKDGSPLLVSLNGRRVFAEDGYSDGFEMIVEDVSERRSLEGQLRQAQKMEAVGRLAGGVAHDFNNLLTAILGYTELLIERLDEGDPRRGDAVEIRKAAERAGGLTRQLLAFSRKQVLQPKPLDLNATVASIEPMLRRLIGEDVQLAIAGGSDLTQVTADPGQIEQVIMNLAVNARDAMPDGGRLTIETTNLDLDATYARQHPSVTPGRHVMLAVSDNGCGMTEEVKSHLFEPFFTTKEGGKGTGLGLATVYGIVRQSGGHIWVSSELGRGTSFKIYFPAVTNTDDERCAVQAERRAARGSETVLLVEDEDAVRTLTRELLARQGYNVLEASNGEEALRVASTFAGTIHLLLTDVVMPEMSGRDLVRRFLTSRPRTRVLYTSGYTDHAVVRSGEIRDGIGFLQKPFTSDSLIGAVRLALEGQPGSRSKA
jgi:two-component system cell cycle sensor histidine kinase/response regulator CckA